MGTIEDLHKIQKKARKDSKIKAEKKSKEVEKKARADKRTALARADGDLAAQLSEIKEYARENPYKKETTVSLGTDSLSYANRAVENLKKEGFAKVILENEFHKEEFYADGGYWSGAYTYYWAKISW